MSDSACLLVLDVDGVVRHDLHSKADPTIIDLVHDLIDDDVHAAAASSGAGLGLRVAFLSGTHSHALELEPWRSVSVGLSGAFRGCFSAGHFESGRVRIVGQSGADCCVSHLEVSATDVEDEEEDQGRSVATPSSSVQSADANNVQTQAPSQRRRRPRGLAGAPHKGVSLQHHQMHTLPVATRLRLLQIVLHEYGLFLQRTHNLTAAEGEEFEALLAGSLARAQADPDGVPPDRTPPALEAVAAFAHAKCDPFFRVVSHGSNAEIDTAPERAPIGDSAALRVEAGNLQRAIRAALHAAAATDPSLQALCDHGGAGVSFQNGVEFIWAAASCMSKELACTAIIADVMTNGRAPAATAGESLMLAEKASSALDDGEKVVSGAADAVAALEAADPGLTVVTVGDSMIDYPMHRLAHAAFHVGPLSTWRAMRGEGAQHAARHQHVVHVAPEDGNLAEQALLGGTVRVLTRLRAALQAVRADSAGVSPAERRAKVRDAVVGVARTLWTDVPDN